MIASLDDSPGCEPGRFGFGLDDARHVSKNDRQAGDLAVVVTARQGCLQLQRGARAGARNGDNPVRDLDADAQLDHHVDRIPREVVQRPSFSLEDRPEFQADGVVLRAGGDGFRHGIHVRDAAAAVGGADHRPQQAR